MKKTHAIFAKSLKEKRAEKRFRWNELQKKEKKNSLIGKTLPFCTGLTSWTSFSASTTVR